MGCRSCGQRSANLGITYRMAKAGTTPPLNYTDENVLILQSNPEDCEPYDGGFRSGTAYVVGYGTDKERVYHRGQKAAMIAYATDNQLQPQQISPSQVCDEVFRAVLDGTLYK